MFPSRNKRLTALYDKQATACRCLRAAHFCQLNLPFLTCVACSARVPVLVCIINLRVLDWASVCVEADVDCSEDRPNVGAGDERPLATGSAGQRRSFGRFSGMGFAVQEVLLLRSYLTLKTLSLRAVYARWLDDFHGAVFGRDSGRKSVTRTRKYGVETMRCPEDAHAQSGEVYAGK